MPTLDPLAVQNSDRPELAAAFAATLGGLRLDVALAMARVIFLSDHRKDLPSLQIPTLVLQARKDVAVPLEVGADLASHLPRASLLGKSMPRGISCS